MGLVEYLFLDYLVEMPVELGHVLSPDVDLIFNKPAHKLSREDVCEKLLWMQGEGYVQLIIDGKEITEVKSLLVGVDNCLLYLTSFGGSVWESVFKPDWQQYLLFEESFSREGYVDIEVGSPSREFQYEFLANVPFLGKNTKVEEIRLWEALYWKVFDVGFTAKISVREESVELQKIEKFSGKWRRVWDQGSELKLL